MKNLVIWIIGSNAVGKTTLARRIHQALRTDNNFSPSFPAKEMPNGEKCCISLLSEVSANLGMLTEEGACSGTDSMNTKAKIKASFELACEHRRVVVVEGIMATGTWIDFLKTEETSLMVVHLAIQEEEHLKRLRKRRAEKKGVRPNDIEISEKTKSNVATKRKTFTNLFQRVKPKADWSVEIDTSKMSEKFVWRVVKKNFIKFVNKVI